jgi:putative transposase
MRFKLMGMHQLPAGADLANAVLVRKNKDFYLKVTTFVPKVKQEVFPNEIVGIDAGCSTALTLSDGTKYNVKFPVSKKTRKLQRKLKNKPSHKKKARKSNNCWKLYEKIQKSKDKTLAQKKDKINKIVSEITKKHKCICIQDENVKGWTSQHGKAVQGSSIGGIMDALRSKAHTLVEIDRFFPSTQICSKCDYKQKLDLWQRTYDCPACGASMDRDVNSAINMENEGIKILAERKDFKPVELLTSAISNNGKSMTMKQEALLSIEILLANQRQRPEAPAFRQG